MKSVSGSLGEYLFTNELKHLHRPPDQSKNGSLLARQEKTMNEEWFRLFAGRKFRP